MLYSMLRTLIIYLLVIVALRLMGKRQLGEMQPSELVTTFLISNVASVCIEEPDLPLLSSFVPIFLIASLEILNSTAAWYFPRYASLLFGKPVTVLRNGEIQQDALRQLRITASDLAEAMRGKDVFSPDEVAWGVIEPNGSLSIAPTPTSEDASVMLPLLIDGQVYTDNLNALQMSSSQLDQLLHEKNLRRNQVLVLLSDGEELCLIPKKKATQN